MANHGGLDLLDRDLHLIAPRAHPGRGVLRQPADDLRRGPLLRRVIRQGDRRIDGCGERPGLGSVDHDLDEPQRLVVLAEPPLRASVGGVAGNPPLVVVAIQAAAVSHRDRAVGPIRDPDIALREPRALGQVVVISARPVGLDIVAGSSC